MSEKKDFNPGDRIFKMPEHYWYRVLAKTEEGLFHLQVIGGDPRGVGHMFQSDLSDSSYALEFREYAEENAIYPRIGGNVSTGSGDIKHKR